MGKNYKKYPAEVWIEGDKEKMFHIPELHPSISKIELGDQYIPDKYMGNNSWEAKS